MSGKDNIMRKKARNGILTFISLASALFFSVFGMNSIRASAGVIEDYYLQDCVDICDSSWLGRGAYGEYGWVKHTDYTQGLDQTQVGVTLDKYKHQWTNEYVMYWYGGDDGGLYNQEDVFAIEFAVDMPEDGFVIRVDEYVVWISSEWIRIGNNDQEHGNDAFHRAYWFHDIGLKGRYFVQNPVSLSGFIKVRMYMETEEGETTVVVQAGDEYAMGSSLTKRTKFDSCAIIAGYDGLNIYSSYVADVGKKLEKVEEYLEYEVVSQESKDQLQRVTMQSRAKFQGKTVSAETVEGIGESLDNVLTGDLLADTIANAIALIEKKYPMQNNEVLENAKTALQNATAVEEVQDKYQDVLRVMAEQQVGTEDKTETSIPDSQASEQPYTGCAGSVLGVGVTGFITLLSTAFVLKIRDR